MLATFVPLAAATFVAALLVATATLFLFVTSFVATLVAAAFFTAALAAFSLRVGVKDFVVFGYFFSFAPIVASD